MICLNLSFATVTSRLVPLRRPLSWDSFCGDDGHIHSFFLTVSPSSDWTVLLSNDRLLSGNEMLSLENKKGRNKSAAVQFVKNNWGESRKIN